MSHVDQFLSEFYFWGSSASIENWLEPKIEPSKVSLTILGEKKSTSNSEDNLYRVNKLKTSRVGINKTNTELIMYPTK